jgi:hypothetical protein
MHTATTSTIIALFESRIAAERAVNSLVAAGFTRENVSVITGNAASPSADIPNIGPLDHVGAGADAGSGAAIGGLAGFIGGIVALAIPGVGPILAVGPLAAGIMGAGIGAAAGGLAGALQSHGVPEADASRLSDAIRRGRVLVSAHVPAGRADHASAILDRSGALDVDEPVEDVGATGSPAGDQFKPLSPEALEAAHLKPGEGMVDRFVRGTGSRSRVYPGFTGMGPASNT